MKINYKTQRNAYYAGIAILISYGMPNIKFVRDYIYPILNYEISPGFPLIFVLSIVMAIAAFAAYKYRKLGWKNGIIQ